MTKKQPRNKIKLLRVLEGSQEYLTQDMNYLIRKTEKGWIWEVSEGTKWVRKDRRYYKTRAWCLLCVETDKYQSEGELELWLG